MKNVSDRTLALGGVFQAAWLVDQVARTGKLLQPEYETTIGSLFEFSPVSTEAVFGSRFEIRRGLQALIEQLESREETRNLYVMRYTIGLLILERKLAAQPQMLQKIGSELENTGHQIRHFGLIHENVIAHLADIYSHTISTLTPRIMVSGENNQLQRQENANKVRALLLAGVRAAVLWRQCGGNRWQLFFQRKKYLQQAKNLLA